MKIGARVLKTGLSITLSVVISLLLIPDNSPVLAGIAAITTTQPSVKQSFDSLSKRVIGNTIGGIVAVLMTMIFGRNPIIVGLAAIVTLAILNWLKLSEVINLSIITLVAVMLNPSENFIMIAVYRVLETIIGVVVSFLVNWLIAPPHYDKTFYNDLVQSTLSILVLIRATLRKNLNFSVVDRDLAEAREQLKRSAVVYSLLGDEFSLNREVRFTKARRLVIYKHMLASSEQALNLLTVLHGNEHLFLKFEKDLQQLILQRLETLLSGHEQILLKFNGRVLSDEVNFIKGNHKYRTNYLNSFFKQAKTVLEDEEGYGTDVNGVIHIMSALYNYEEELLKLNSLIRSYRARYAIEDGADVIAN